VLLIPNYGWCNRPAGIARTLETHFLEVFVSNLDRVTCSPDWRFSWFLLVSDNCTVGQKYFLSNSSHFTTHQSSCDPTLWCDYHHQHIQTYSYGWLDMCCMVKTIRTLNCVRDKERTKRNITKKCFRKTMHTMLRGWMVIWTDSNRVLNMATVLAVLDLRSEYCANGVAGRREFNWDVLIFKE
jgi:hypothetical protein